MPTITSLHGAMRDTISPMSFLMVNLVFLTISELAVKLKPRSNNIQEAEVEKLKNQSNCLSSTSKLLVLFSRPHSKEVIDFLRHKRQRRELAWKRFESPLRSQNRRCLC